MKGINNQTCDVCVVPRLPPSSSTVGWVDGGHKFSYFHRAHLISRYNQPPWHNSFHTVISFNTHNFFIMQTLYENPPTLPYN